MAEALTRALFVTDKPINFDLGLMTGVFLGAFIASALFGELKLLTDRLVDQHPVGALDHPVPGTPTPKAAVTASGMERKR